MSIALHNSGLPFVLAMVFGIVALYGALVLMGDDDDRPEDRWLR